MKGALITLACLTALALGEPPVSNYLPPNNQYIPPDNQYIPPNNQYIPPNNQYIPPRPTQTYGSPGFTGQTGVSFKPPSTQYGTPSSNYGPPIKPTIQYGPPGGGYGGGNGGYDDKSEPANYNFEYHVEDAQSGNDFGHKEERKGDVAKGKYFVLLPDGRRQIVEYTADQDGYKPKITYEQTGGGYGGGGYPSGGGGGGGGGGGYQY